MVAAAAVIWLITLIQRKAIATITRIQQNPKALGQIAIAAFLGPTLGVTLSLVAIQRIPVGIASTLTSLPPVFLLPISYFVFGERFGWQAVLGTLLAIAGVALLFLV
jgi:drug/metabolite transporter (DMT)-like permease